MCGLAGFITDERGQLNARLIERVAGLLRHRGPDDLGFYTWSEARGGEASAAPPAIGPREVGLVHRRLVILDPSHHARQPMTTPDGRYTMIFNGEIYNFVELRRVLETKGHRFRSTGDSAVLLAALSEWGTDALRRLTGMFALALIDTVSRTVLLARDFAGMKPLYVTRWTGGFAFASEIKALLELPGVSREADPQHVYDYLRAGLVDHDDGTMFSAVRQLPAGHYMLVDLDTPRPAEAVRFWCPNPNRRFAGSFRRAAKALSDLFLDSIQMHLRADVPIGVALSGGIDSSAILTAVRHVLGPGHAIRAFGYVPDDPGLNEERWMQIAGRSARADIHKITIRPDQFWRDLDHLVDVQEQPFGSPSIYAQYCVMRAAREQGVGVMLGGQGADEMFGGYRSFLTQRVSELVRQKRHREALRLARRASKLPGAAELRLLELVPDHRSSGPDAQGKAERRPSPRPWFNVAWFRDRDVVLKPRPRTFCGDEFRDRLHDTFIRSSLPHLLRYEDRNSMAFSIESRLPFLTPDLVEFAFSLPNEFLVDAHGRGKAILRHSLKGILPARIRRRKDKLGFQTPDRSWIVGRNSELRALVGSDAAQRIPVIEFGAAEREWASTMNGSSPFGKHLWRWVNLARWVERFDVRFS